MILKYYKDGLRQAIEEENDAAREYFRWQIVNRYGLGIFLLVEKNLEDILENILDEDVEYGLQKRIKKSF